MKSGEKISLKKVDMEHGNVVDKGSAVWFSSTIRIKMIAAFLVPIAFIILLGIASYEKAAEGICNSYENSAGQTINATARYVQFGAASIEALSTQYIVDDMLLKYLYNYSNDKVENNQNKRSINNSFSAKEITDEFISGISVFSADVAAITTAASVRDNIYEGFLETETGKRISESGEVFWIGKDPFLDENIGGGTDSYSLRLVRKIQSADALAVIDMDVKTIQDILNGMGFEETGMIGFVTADGKEIISGNQEAGADQSFFDKEFYRDSVTAEETGNAFYVDYHGEDNLFLYSKIGNTGAMICALIPKSRIVSQADSIKKLTVIIVIIACAIAIITGLYLSTGIDRTIKYIIANLKKAAEGDLSVDFITKRKDEFRILISEINNTFFHMKELIIQVKRMSSGVSAAAAGISDTSKEFSGITKDISNAMKEIEQGIMQQAKDAEECLHQMDRLSQKIVQMDKSINEIGKIGEDTKKRIQEGTIVTEKLTDQTNSTIMITTQVVNGIKKLDEKSKSIGDIVKVISDISSQTNLLSLNASIEAARAGKLGKGFAVVADEIRTLSDQTQQSVYNIQSIIKDIQNDTNDLSKATKDAEDVLILQDTAVKNTTDSYQGINESVDNLMLQVKYVIDSVNNIEESRVSTLGAVENISAVLEEIAASTNNVNQISNHQVGSIGALHQSASNLNQNSADLAHAVLRFKL
ncbi:MAG TPA: methyl-accepting chemotaxis protein [Clostridiales bacterium]|nr:methyl-accepting chemotaxis protein [Clostridiales bacterium]